MQLDTVRSVWVAPSSVVRAPIARRHATHVTRSFFRRSTAIQVALSSLQTVLCWLENV